MSTPPAWRAEFGDRWCRARCRWQQDKRARPGPVGRSGGVPKRGSPTFRLSFFIHGHGQGGEKVGWGRFFDVWGLSEAVPAQIEAFPARPLAFPPVLARFPPFRRPSRIVQHGSRPNPSAFPLKRHGFPGVQRRSRRLQRGSRAVRHGSRIGERRSRWPG